MGPRQSIASCAALVLVVATAWPGEARAAGKGKKDPGSGIVKITSMPIGAAVEVDGKYTCHTPCTTEIPAGSHSFKVFLKGFVDAYMTVEIRPDIVEKLKFNLAKSGKGKIKSLPTTSFQTVAEKGFLTIKSTPSGLPARINGIPVDDDTPLTVEIEQGKYYVTVQQGDAVMEKVVDVEPGVATVVEFDIKEAVGKSSPGIVKSGALMEGKKAILDEMMATGFARVVVDAEQEGPFSVLVDEEPAGVDPDPGGKYVLVLPAGQTVVFSFAKADHTGLMSSLTLGRDHEYRLHLDFLPDTEARLAALMAERPDVDAEPVVPGYEAETFSKKSNASRCLLGGILLSVGLTSWTVAPIMITGGIKLGEKGLAVGGGVFLPMGLAFNVWGIYNLVTGCRKIEQTDEDAAARNAEKKAKFEAELAEWEKAQVIDAQIEDLEKLKVSGADGGHVEVSDMGTSSSGIMSPEAEELAVEIYGTLSP